MTRGRGVRSDEEAERGTGIFSGGGGITGGVLRRSGIGGVAFMGVSGSLDDEIRTAFGVSVTGVADKLVPLPSSEDAVVEARPAAALGLVLTTGLKIAPPFSTDL